MARSTMRFIPACAGNSFEALRGSPRYPVHPRVCGEQSCSYGIFTAVIGSSPRVRGTDASMPCRAIILRFIPACAGNRSESKACRRTQSVHPRVCGEQCDMSMTFGRANGSSPRVRGTAGSVHGYAHCSRFIPACAGNRYERSLTNFPIPVHPRVCGEQSAASVFSGEKTGSSPRVRGTGQYRYRNRLQRRFIPACAGNSNLYVISFRLISVHPRVCGEQVVLNVDLLHQPGSSPRVRGTVSHSVGRSSIARFIPACAGNRCVPLPACRRQSVHPRVCGEQQERFEPVKTQSGSSPRVRGTGSGEVSQNAAMRFIPACAGNRANSGGGDVAEPVHPRVCGEQPDVDERMWYRDGSSPRVRGTVVYDPAIDSAGRFIPACAGNSVEFFVRIEN